jgi:hypothetical protein
VVRLPRQKTAGQAAHHDNAHHDLLISYDLQKAKIRKMDAILTFETAYSLCSLCLPDNITFLLPGKKSIIL